MLRLSPSRALCTACSACALLQAPALATPPEPVARTLIYWMSYDNDLTMLAEPILAMISQGLSSPEIVVTVHVDRRGPGGMERVIFDGNGETRIPLPHEEGSADLALLARELAWVEEHHPAQRYAVVFLNHGGKLGEMSLDETPSDQWLDPRHVAQTLDRWDRQTPGDLDLVFLQQCGKATLETLHAFAPIADVVVASEARIGAPNFYYPKALDQLSQEPNLGAAELGQAMVQNDRPDMYRSYTVAHGQGLVQLPRQLELVLSPLLALGPSLRWGGEPAPAWEIQGERYLDLQGLLGQLYSDNGLDPAPLNAFRDWWNRDVLFLHQVSPDHPQDADRLFGATVLLPINPGEWRSYADFPLYQQTQLPLLMDRLLTVPTSRH